MNLSTASGAIDPNVPGLAGVRGASINTAAQSPQMFSLVQNFTNQGEIEPRFIEQFLIGVYEYAMAQVMTKAVAILHVNDNGDLSPHWNDSSIAGPVHGTWVATTVGGGKSNFTESNRVVYLACELVPSFLPGAVMIH